MHSWKRTYWAVWLSNLVTSIGMMSFLPFFPTHLESMGIQGQDEISAWTGVIFGSAPLMAAFMGPIWGAVGDRFGRRLMILRALLAITICVGAMAFATTPMELLLLRMLQGTFSGFIAPSITLVGVLAPPDQQGRVTGSLQTALAAGTIVGPLLGAFLQSELGLSSLFLCVSGAVFVSALLILFMVPADRLAIPNAAELLPERRAWKVSLIAAPRRFLRELHGHLESKELRYLLLMIFGVQFAVGSTAPLMELFVREIWDGDAELVPKLTGMLFTIIAVPDLVSMPIWGQRGDRKGHARMIRLSAVLTGFALLAHVFVPVFAALALARFFLGFASAGVKPCAFGLLAEVTAVERRGSAVGLVLSARMLAFSTAAMLGGLLSAVIGLRALFALNGVGLLLLVVWISAKTKTDLGEVEFEPKAEVAKP
ncbi:MAG: DHA1 family multidrug resistance protein-like MFS transporter [Planctomycetota bacterium]|jgi:DHA1 family multidrug resistance protein-like MFS transporter